ncbi:hypothetical protein [Stenomitos frigidus]|uniref:Uncharacterized protein n=1 Tax=Stenomitos frigidus ULC18 TaxID=2107698 RepID=A0A2T1EB20_9CYAN|nr:hypothetical protein [Stenomitos frigidus]PSB29908.1 hypothetical protein C7B82_10165 [Stenomitos frigidus ULC18]
MLKRLIEALLMGKRKQNSDAAIAAQNWDRGLGTSHDFKPICVKFPPLIDALLRAMESRSDYIRAAVERQLKDDGLLTSDQPTEEGKNA